MTLHWRHASYPNVPWITLSQARYRGKKLNFDRWHLKVSWKLCKNKMASQTARVSLYIAVRTCVRAQGYGKLIVLLGTIPWLCGYRPLRIHITGRMWTSPKQGLTAVSELSRSEIEQIWSANPPFCVAFPDGWVAFHVTQPIPVSYPAPTSLMPHFATPLPSFHNHFQGTQNPVNTLKTHWAPGCVAESLIQISVTD